MLVVGGGFIGSEIAAALQMNGAKVTMVFPDDGIAGPAVPGRPLAVRHRLLPREGRGRPHRRAREPGADRSADVVVAGLGIEPNTDLAAAAGLRVDNGIVVDDHGRAGGREDVFAAGDVARFPASALGTEMRVEHEDHANTHGKVVGENMAGADTPYDHLPFFYSDLFDLGYEAVGEVELAALDGRALEGAGPRGRCRLRGSATASRGDSCSGTSGARSTTPAR